MLCLCNIGYRINKKQILIWVFSVSRFIVKDRDSFFTSAQRSLIVWQVLMRTRYGDSKEDQSKVEMIFIERKSKFSSI